MPKSYNLLRPQIVLSQRCDAWDIPDSWWWKVAQPGLELLLEQTRDPEGITYALLREEVGKCPLPPSSDVQVDNPAATNFWNGPPPMLYLVHHVKQEVELALKDDPPRFRIFTVYGGRP